MATVTNELTSMLFQMLEAKLEEILIGPQSTGNDMGTFTIIDEEFA